LAKMRENKSYPSPKSSPPRGEETEKEKLFTIRRYEPKDNKVIRELDRVGVEQMLMPDEVRLIPNPHTDFDNVEEAYLKEGDFIVAEEAGEVVAMGAFKRKTAECAEFKRLRIRPDRQRRGYGEAIMRELLKRAAIRGYTEAFLDTLVTNKRAQTLFEKLGFKRDGRGMRGPFDLYFYTIKLENGGK
jgi:N-acetylglutamate synthase-like GNAT family acetyltransferase